MLPEMSQGEIQRRFDESDRRISSKVSQVLYDRDMRELQTDYEDLKNSYRRLVQVAVAEAFGLLVAILLITIQIALSFGAGT